MSTSSMNSRNGDLRGSCPVEDLANSHCAGFLMRRFWQLLFSYSSKLDGSYGIHSLRFKEPDSKMPLEIDPLFDGASSSPFLPSIVRHKTVSVKVLPCAKRLLPLR